MWRSQLPIVQEEDEEEEEQSEQYERVEEEEDLLEEDEDFLLEQEEQLLEQRGTGENWVSKDEDDGLDEDVMFNFVVQAIAAIGSIILDKRRLINADDLERRSLQGHKVMIVKENTEVGQVFYELMAGIEDAIMKRYLRKVVVFMTKHSRADDAVYEAYFINIHYPKEGRCIVVKTGVGRELSAVEYGGLNDMLIGTFHLLDKLAEYTMMLPELPENAHAHIRLIYHADVPFTYKPVGFTAPKRVPALFDEMEEIGLGGFNCRCIGCSIRMALPSPIIWSFLERSEEERTNPSTSIMPSLPAEPESQSEESVPKLVSDSSSSAAERPNELSFASLSISPPPQPYLSYTLTSTLNDTGKVMLEGDNDEGDFVPHSPATSMDCKSGIFIPCKNKSGRTENLNESSDSTKSYLSQWTMAAWGEQSHNENESKDERSPSSTHSSPSRRRRTRTDPVKKRVGRALRRAAATPPRMTRRVYRF